MRWLLLSVPFCRWKNLRLWEGELLAQGHTAKWRSWPVITGRSRSRAYNSTLPLEKKSGQDRFHAKPGGGRAGTIQNLRNNTIDWGKVLLVKKDKEGTFVQLPLIPNYHNHHHHHDQSWCLSRTYHMWGPIQSMFPQWILTTSSHLILNITLSVRPRLSQFYRWGNWDMVTCPKTSPAEVLRSNCLTPECRLLVSTSPWQPSLCRLEPCVSRHRGLAGCLPVSVGLLDFLSYFSQHLSNCINYLHGSLLPLQLHAKTHLCMCTHAHTHTHTHSMNFFKSVTLYEPFIKYNTWQHADKRWSGKQCSD